VRTLFDEALISHGPVRSTLISWDGRDEAGRRVGAGAYFYRLKVGAFTRSKKMLLFK